MDLQRFLSELPQHYQHWGTPQACVRDPQLHPSSGDRTAANLRQMLSWGIQCLESEEVICQFGSDSDLLQQIWATDPDLPPVKLLVLPQPGTDLQTPSADLNQIPELTLAQWSQQFGAMGIGVVYVPQFTNYRSHLLTLFHSQPWLSSQALLITSGAKWSALKQANLDFLAVYPQACLGLNLGLTGISDISFGQGIQILFWQGQTQPETEVQHWQIYQRISQTLIQSHSPTTLSFRSPYPTDFPAQILCLPEILSAPQNQMIYTQAIQQQPHFLPTGFYTPDADPDLLAAENYRQSLKLDLESFPQAGALVRQTVLGVLPQVLESFGLDPIEAIGTEMELVAHNHGHHYGIHSDNATPETQARVLSYLYYFCQDPKPFWGGQLRVYDTYQDPHSQQMQIRGYFNEFVPENNCLVFFRSSCIHEVLPVICPEQRFEQSRFTINGWIRPASGG